MDEPSTLTREGQGTGDRSVETNLFMALTHFPVVNRNGEPIASAVTNLDLHDMSRAAKTFGVKAFYVVTPLGDQKLLVEKIVSHWVTGIGAKFNPKRRVALELIRIKNSVDEVVEHICLETKVRPETVVTSAGNFSNRIGFDGFRKMLRTGKPYLLVFGTGWGLTDEFMAGVDYVLEPISGSTGYNHLSVRSAAAIILDRLQGQNNDGIQCRDVL